MRQHATEPDNPIPACLKLYRFAKQLAKKVPKGNVGKGEWVAKWAPAEDGLTHLTLAYIGRLTGRQREDAGLIFDIAEFPILRTEDDGPATKFHFLIETAAPKPVVQAREETDAAGNPIQVGYEAAIQAIAGAMDRVFAAAAPAGAKGA